MSGNWTYFPPVGSGGSGANDYDRDTFPDYSLNANSNSGLTDNASTNPLRFFFGNPDVVRFGARELEFDSIALIEDTTRWVDGDPTWEVRLKNDPGDVYVYAVGNVIFEEMDGGYKKLRLQGAGSRIGVTGVLRRANFISMSQTNLAAAQSFVDGSVETTGLNAFAGEPTVRSLRVGRQFLLGSRTLQTNNLHTYEIRCPNFDGGSAGLEITGVAVYSENASVNIEAGPGRTYVNKNKIESVVAAALPVPATLSASFVHLGAVHNIRKITGGSYAISTFEVPVLAAAASGSTGTNLVSVGTGLGGSFPLGSGVMIQQGSTILQSFVVNQSSDVLTLGTTLPFTLSGATITQAFVSGPSFTIDPNRFELVGVWDPRNYVSQTVTTSGTNGLGSTNVLFPASEGVTNRVIGFKDPQNNLMFTTSNTGFVQNTFQTVSYIPTPLLWAQRFAGGVSLALIGNFEAAEVEFYAAGTGNTLGYQFGVDGLNTFTGTIIPGVTGGYFSFPVVSNAGIGLHGLSIAWQTGATLSSIERVGLSRIKLYRHRGPSMIGGELARFEQTQSFVPSNGATLSWAPSRGSVEKIFPDEIAYDGNWFPDVSSGATTFSGIQYRNNAAPASARFDFFGDRLLLNGIQNSGTSYIATVNGASFGIPLNTIVTLPSYGLNSVQLTVQAGTSLLQIQGAEILNSFKPIETLRTSFSSVDLVNGIIDGKRIKDKSINRRALKPRKIPFNKLVGTGIANNGSFLQDDLEGVAVSNLYFAAAVPGGGTVSRVVELTVNCSGSPVLFYVTAGNTAGSPIRNASLPPVGGISGYTFTLKRNPLNGVTIATERKFVQSTGVQSQADTGSFFVMDVNPPPGKNTYFVDVTYDAGTYNADMVMIAMEL